MASDRPSEDDVRRAVTALAPFVHEWRLPLNPENLEEMAWAVLLHARSDESLEHIDEAAKVQLADAQSANERMQARMTEVPAKNRMLVVPAYDPAIGAVAQVEGGSLTVASTADGVVLRGDPAGLRDTARWCMALADEAAPDGG